MTTNTVEPRVVDAGGDVYMQGLTYNWFNGQFSEYDFGAICYDGAFKPSGMAFGVNGDFWVSGNTGVCRYPAALLPAPGVKGSYNVMNLPTGVNPTLPSVDRDGRVWFGVDNDAAHSGGLTVFEVLGNVANRQSVWTTDYTWLNAPIGSKTASGTKDYDSSINVVYANGERVWTARGSSIYAIAQRWQQLDERNNLRDKTLTGLWTVRGRLFTADADHLYILQPDGVTWENLAVIGVEDVVADARGQIWIAAADGVRRYVSGGVAEIDSPTPAPQGPIYALAVDRRGRVWIGGGRRHPLRPRPLCDNVGRAYRRRDCVLAGRPRQPALGEHRRRSGPP
ncbi:MAG: two-component regulator propeller domain-containing protein [Caldilineaceae bacterium]